MSKQYLIRLAILAVVGAVVFTLLLGQINLALIWVVMFIVFGGGVLFDMLRSVRQGR